jgi:hypothetical protein
MNCEGVNVQLGALGVTVTSAGALMVATAFDGIPGSTDNAVVIEISAQGTLKE